MFATISTNAINDYYSLGRLAFDALTGLPTSASCNGYNDFHNNSVTDLYSLRSPHDRYNEKLEYISIPNNYYNSHDDASSSSNYATLKHCNKKRINCSCPSKYIPARYNRNGSNNNNVYYCIVRDPLERLISFFLSNSNSSNINDINNFLDMVVTENFTQHDYYYNYLSQHEYIHSSKGQKHCNYVIRLDDNTDSYLKYLYMLYRVNDDNKINTSNSNSTNFNFNNIVSNLDINIATAARRLYWKDYCLLGYYQDSGYDKVASYNYIVINEYLSRHYSTSNDSDNNISMNRNDSNTNIINNNSSSIIIANDSHSNNEWYSVPEKELAAGISPQMRHAKSWAKVDELYIPESLRFNRYGLPNKEGCDDYNSRYQDVVGLYAPIRALEHSKKVAFLHIPKNAGTSIRKVFSWLWPPKGAKQGYNCRNRDNREGTTCTCSFWHVPPRYFNPKIFDDRIVFCVARDPLDKILSKFKMVNKNVSDSAKASAWIQHSIATIYKHYFDEYCHIMNQFEYIWNENGERTCQHVIRYENNVTSSVNDIIDSYKLQNKRMSAEVDQQSRHHPDVPLTVNDLQPEVAAAARRFYWRDYCLLGYYENNPWVQ